jgi:hypothetical protein
MIEQWPAGVLSACVFSESGDCPGPSSRERAVVALFQQGTPERLLTGGPICRMRFYTGSVFASPITSVTAESGI